MEILHKLHNTAFKDRLIGAFPDIQSFPVSVDEKMWLKYIVQKEEAGQFLSEAAIGKVNQWLQDISTVPYAGEISEKGQVPMRLPSGGLIAKLRAGIIEQRAMKFTLGSSVVQGIPLKIEVWLSIGEWFLLVKASGGIQKVKLSAIDHIEEISSIEPDSHGQEEPLIIKDSLLIEVPPQYNEEKQRLFYLFSSFEKEIHYDDPHYRIKLYYKDDEEEYILSTLLMLGKKIKVLDEKWQRKLVDEVRTILKREYQTPR